MKKQTLKKIKSTKNQYVFVSQPKEIKKIVEKKQQALKIAKEKVQNNGKIESALFTGEAFGRALFEEYLKNKAKKWTIEKWLKPVVENIFNPMGMGATFTEITNSQIKTLIFRYNNVFEEQNNQYINSLFTYGYLRGMFLSAFPNGELILKSSMAMGAPMDIFTFKTDYFENEN